jgi:hypothetical protein
MERMPEAKGQASRLEQRYHCTRHVLTGEQVVISLAIVTGRVRNLRVANEHLVDGVFAGLPSFV